MKQIFERFFKLYSSIKLRLLYVNIPSMSCQGQFGWFLWSVCLIPTSMSYIHQQKSTLYNIYVPTISLTHLLYVMSRSVWLIPWSVCLIPTSMSYIHQQKFTLYNICVPTISLTHPLYHVKVSLADSLVSLPDPHFYVIYTIYAYLLYHWPIPYMSCQGQSGWFPWSVCLIPTFMSYTHQQKSTLYNICIPTISLTHPLYVMSRSVWLIPLVSLPDPHFYVIYTSTEVHIIQYICPYYITDPSSLCHVKVILADSPGQSVWSPHLCHIDIHRNPSNKYMCTYYITDPFPLCHVKVSLADSLVILADPYIYVI